MERSFPSDDLPDPGGPQIKILEALLDRLGLILNLSNCAISYTVYYRVREQSTSKKFPLYNSLTWLKPKVYYNRWFLTIAFRSAYDCLSNNLSEALNFYLSNNKNTRNFAQAFYLISLR